MVASVRGMSIRLSLEAESKEFSEMISTWTKTCQDGHSACKSSTSTRTLPTRVIDVGSPDGRTAPHPCDTNGEPGDYIALSHCWGGKQPLRTTKENMCSMKTCIPWAKLPNTFQDAIAVTRRLGIRCLWIDSLFIVQDDAQDWEREAARMALIFEAAYLTIAATAATDGSQGLFPRERGHEFVMGSSEVEPHVFMREKRSDGCFLPRRLNTGPVSIDVEVDYKVDGLYPLQERAWCFQELVLSPRVLHFTHSEVVWHCRTKWDCECGAVGLGGSYIRKFDTFIQNPAGYEEEDEFAKSVQWPDIKAADPSGSWRGIVSVFTSNQITYREDILPALSGTAKKFGLLRTGRYVAGLWEDSFANDL
ncbi:hypothetical protein INS49_012191 [Diaporthe citri]|uniref:uncharacterized protein n=1 Tax=Diaporthe citri TaxID=83186 RepID=UPI001C806CD4|nr:uncharacterized protein INS49_012191 [Diaporthe citri]KAG6358673.1 hypothetical protein INS49_012191 [Diaporthe citri]